MNILPHVLHAGARPIGVAEFADAIRATCPPRFPKARGSLRRQVGLAISGGVDSMALAFLCSRLRSQDRSIKISDNPVSSFCGIIIDHGLREGSFEEAKAVANALGAMNIQGDIYQLSWAQILSDYKHPKELPNFESVARKLRYRMLGGSCSRRRIASLLLAHHEDDQYETVLMRLLQGHGSRGLRGMKKATDIPECEGEYGAYQSGYVEDQKQIHPFYNYNLPKRERKILRRQLMSSIDRLMQDEELCETRDRGADGGAGVGNDGYNFDLPEFDQAERVVASDVHNIDVEDGGLYIYRPLLEFGKDRLIATCLENNIPWWEDQTNHDATLTLRNAVRHLHKSHHLPKALQKPAILDLARRCERRAQAQDAAANRLLSRAVIHEFEPNVGTAVVQFPGFRRLESRREMRSPERRQARNLQHREIAGILIQKMLALVSPGPETPPLSNLQNAISRLFPSLASHSESALTSPAKAFAIAGVHLVPVESNPQPKQSTASRQPLTWYLTRTPYPSHLSLPRFRMPYWSLLKPPKNSHSENSDDDGDRSGSPTRLPWSKWMRWELWDNRFWIRLAHRLPYRIIVQPFAKEHAKPFRELLPPDDRGRLALLKRYAPGKVRYTLPAIYLEEDLDLDSMVPRPDYPSPEPTPEEELRKSRRVLNDPHLVDTSKMKLLALPTLGIQIPGVEHRLRYEVRYRRVDRKTLETAGTFHRGSFVPPRKVRRGSDGAARRRRV
ncbi:hypothetical protein DL770_004728 [Monosporascus sp. CRB-9-2]|nr:hypothetical protein DL770_004728 [Monosporascus sp. CRB-9-2]